MRLPALSPRSVAGNLQWMTTGTVTASFVAPGRNVRFASGTQTLAEFYRRLALYGSLPGAFQHRTLMRRTPVSAVIERMARSAPAAIEDYPHWQRRIVETAEFVAGMDPAPVEPWSLLTVELPVHAAGGVAVAARQFAALTGAMPKPPGDEDVERAQRDADALLANLRTFVPDLQPATAGDLRWYCEWACTFGGLEPAWTHPYYQDPEPGRTMLMPLCDAGLNLDGHHGTFVTVDTDVRPERGEPAVEQRVHQAILVVSDHPSSWRYPGFCLWDELTDLPFTVELVASGRVVANRKARAELNPAFKALAWMEQESEDDATPHVDAQDAWEQINAELDALREHRGPAVPSTLAVRVGARTVDELDDRVRTVSSVLDAEAVRLTRPRGRQTQLWASLLATGGDAPVLAPFRRQLHARDLASVGLHHADVLGDDRGRVYALAGAAHPDAPPRLIHRDPTWGPRDDAGNRAAVRANTGDLGVGKSLDVKLDVLDVLCLGGGAIVIDRSLDREWSRASLAFPVEPSVVDPASSRHTLDPLRVFAANLPDDVERRADLLRLAETHTLGYLALKLRIGDDDDQRYDVLTHAVQALLSDRTLLPPSMPNLLRLLNQYAGHDAPEPALPSAGERDAAAKLAMRLGNVARSSTAAANVMRDAPPVDLTNPAVVFSVPGLDLDTADGHATIYLLSALTIAFLHATDRFNLVALTEFEALAKDRRGARLANETTRQTRRANGGLVADSQLVVDYVDPQLFRIRTIARNEDPDAALAALRFAGVADPSDSLVAALMTAETGMKLYTDHRRRTGWADVLPPLDEDTFRAFRTDPGRPVSRWELGSAAA